MGRREIRGPFSEPYAKRDVRSRDCFRLWSKLFLFLRIIAGSSSLIVWFSPSALADPEGGACSKLENFLSDLGELEQSMNQQLKVIQTKRARTPAYRVPGALESIRERAEELISDRDPGLVLEGRVALMALKRFPELIVAFRKPVGRVRLRDVTDLDILTHQQELGIDTRGEIDLELIPAIVEITTSPSGKQGQLEKYINDDMINPLRKPVILYAPNYKGYAERKALELPGVKVVRTPGEFEEAVREAESHLTTLRVVNE